MVKEPLLGLPGVAPSVVLERLVGLVPQTMTVLKLNVSPMSLAGKVAVNVCLPVPELALMVNTTLVAVKPLTPVPSAPVMMTWAKMVSLLGLKIWIFHVWMPWYFERDRWCFHSNCMKVGAWHVPSVLSMQLVPLTTVTMTVVTWLRFPLVPVALTW